MKTKNFLRRTVLLIVTALTTLCANAVIDGGTITIAVGETYSVDASFGGGLTQTGSWSASNSKFTFVSRGNTSCKIRGNQVGTGTLYYNGAAGAYDVNYYWTVNVVASGGYKDGDKFTSSSNGVSIQYKVISASNKTCMVGTGYAEDEDLAVSKSLSVQSLTIPETANGFTVVEIGQCAFYECKNIKKIIMPKTIERIGQTAFQYCTSLTSIVVPDAVTKIGYGAFSLCEKLEEVTIGKSVKEIGMDVLWADRNLKTITVLATEPPSLDSDVLSYAEEVYDNATLYVPAGCVAKYKEAYTWRRFSHIEKIGGGDDNPGGITIDATNFPDENFRNYLLGLSEGRDGILTEGEIKGITNIKVSDKNISNLKGIEYFTALTLLYCYNNQLTALDVSKNTALETLQCFNNQLTTLDVSKNTALSGLYCYDNQLTALDVSKNTALTSLWCYNNQLTTLNVSKNTALTYLRCYHNQLTVLDVSKNTALTQLYCHVNQLTALDVSKNTALTLLYCSNNQLTALDVSKNTALTSISCFRNQIKGAAMDALISSLPQNNTTEEYQLQIYYLSGSTTEGNICTIKQAEAAKAKGWSPCYTTNGWQWYEYEGYDDSSPVSITLPTTATVKVNQSITLTPTIEPAEAVTTLTWTSDDETIATVSSEGVVTGLKKGQTIISVKTENGKTAYCKLTVEEEITSIAIDATNFPDENFRNYLLGQDYGQDGILTEAEIKGITNINVSYKNISSLKGIEYFTALTKLYCNHNQLTSLDVSDNVMLTELSCYNNMIKGVSMDNLIANLPENSTNVEHRLIIYGIVSSNDENRCTKEQVAAAKAKGWSTYFCDENEGMIIFNYYGYDADPISITLPEMETVAVNKTIKLTPTIKPAGVTTELTWTSDDETIAKVTSSGMVAGIKAGTAIITVRTSNGLKAECFVIVEDPTGVTDVKADGRANVPVYTVSGQKVTGSLKGKKGVYIVGGKKVVVK